MLPLNGPARHRHLRHLATHRRAGSTHIGVRRTHYGAAPAMCASANNLDLAPDEAVSTAPLCTFVGKVHTDAAQVHTSISQVHTPVARVHTCSAMVHTRAPEVHTCNG